LSIFQKLLDYFLVEPVNTFRRYLILRRAIDIGKFVLVNGTYYCSDKFKGVQNHKSTYFLPTNLVVRLLYYFIPKKFVINGNNDFVFENLLSGEKSLFEGDFLLVANKSLKKNSRFNFKIFDSKNNFVFSSFVSENDYYSYLNGVKFFGASYHIPRILFFEGSNRYLIEEKINFITKINETIQSKLQVGIFQGYINSLNNLNYDFRPVPKIVYKSSNPEVIELIGRINRFIIDIPCSKLPYFQQHGDLSMSNILVENETYIPYIIDWEHMGIYVILYDPLWNWVNEAFWNKNFFMIKLYYSNQFDEYVSTILSKFNLLNFINYKPQLLLIVLVEVFNRRLHTSDYSKSIDDFFLNNISGILAEVDLNTN